MAGYWCNGPQTFGVSLQSKAHMASGCSKETAECGQRRSWLQCQREGTCLQAKFHKDQRSGHNQIFTASLYASCDATLRACGSVYEHDLLGLKSDLGHTEKKPKKTKQTMWTEQQQNKNLIWSVHPFWANFACCVNTAKVTMAKILCRTVAKLNLNCCLHLSVSSTNHRSGNLIHLLFSIIFFFLSHLTAAKPVPSIHIIL